MKRKLQPLFLLLSTFLSLSVLAEEYTEQDRVTDLIWTYQADNLLGKLYDQPSLKPQRLERLRNDIEYLRKNIIAKMKSPALRKEYRDHLLWSINTAASRDIAMYIGLEEKPEEARKKSMNAYLKDNLVYSERKEQRRNDPVGQKMWASLKGMTLDFTLKNRHEIRNEKQKWKVKSSLRDRKIPEVAPPIEYRRAPEHDSSGYHNSYFREDLEWDPSH